MFDSRLAEWILVCTVPRADREAALGDLMEEYAIRKRSGSPFGAAYWYWSQVLRSVPWFLWIPLRRGGLLGTLIVALGACVAQAAVEVVTAAAIHTLLPPNTAPALLIALGIVLSSLFVMSYLATRVRPGAGMVLAAIVLASAVSRAIVKAPVGFSVFEVMAGVAAPAAAFTAATLSLNAQSRLYMK